MPRGGARPGAGRPKGARSNNKKPKQIEVIMEKYRDRAQKFLGDVVHWEPVEVMMWCMHAAVLENDRDSAFKFAQGAAPYRHARMQTLSVEHKQVGDLEALSITELQSMLLEIGDEEEQLLIEAQVTQVIDKEDDDDSTTDADDE